MGACKSFYRSIKISRCKYRRSISTCLSVSKSVYPDTDELACESMFRQMGLYVCVY